MTELVFKNILRFIALVLLQVFILNNIQFSGYINPYLYVLFIIMLPFNTSKWSLIILGFLLGLSVDILSNTPGLHAAATVFVAFTRPFVIKLGNKRQDYETTALSPSIKELGFQWFFTYSFIIVALHHFFLFFLEEFNFHEFFTTFFRAIVSIIATMILVVLSQYMFIKRK